MSTIKDSNAAYSAARDPDEMVVPQFEAALYSGRARRARERQGDGLTERPIMGQTGTCSPYPLSVISIREPIELGERTTSYHLEIKQNGAWNRSPTDITGATVAGAVIGQRQLWQLPPTTAEALALVIDTANDVPAIAEFGAY